jgi:hypothetical protein
MSFVTKNRLKNWLLIFLLVSNVATISTIFYHRWSFRRHMQEMNPHQKMKDFINNDLGLSDVQKTAFEKERKASDSLRENYFIKMEDVRISIYSQFTANNPDSAIIDSLVRTMSSLYSDINYVGISHNLFMLKTCTADQKTKLQKKYVEMVSDMKAEQQEESQEEKDDD